MQTCDTIILATIHTWSRRLGIPVDVLRDGLRGERPHYWTGANPDDAGPEEIAYSAEVVYRVCADLFKCK